MSDTPIKDLCLQRAAELKRGPEYHRWTRVNTGVSAVLGAQVRAACRFIWDTKLFFLWLVVATAALALRPQPEEPFVASVLSYFSGLSLISVACLLFALPLTRGWAPAAMAFFAVRGMGLHALATFLIADCGDEVYRHITTGSSSEVAVFATTLALLGLFISAVMRRADTTSTPKQFAMALPLRRLTAEERRHVAAHEAGHALMLAALDVIPERASLSIHDIANPSGVCGRLSFDVNGCRLPQAAHMQWWMLLHLAGVEAERQFLGCTLMGGADDLAKWQADARAYLSSGWRGIFYTPPTNAMEQQHNNDAFVALHDAQRALLRQLFADNAAVHAELTDLLIERTTLSYADISPLLARVVLPAGFPAEELKGWRVAIRD